MACYEVGLVAQKGGEDELAEAAFLRACKLGEASGCTNRAAGILTREKPTDELRACTFRTFQISCRAGDPWGCTMLGRDLAKAGKTQEARVVLGQACQLTVDADPACTAAREILDALR